MIETPLPPHVEYLPPLLEGKVLVVNGDMHGRGFFDLGGNWVHPGAMAYLNVAHYEWLHERNSLIKCVIDS